MEPIEQQEPEHVFTSADRIRQLNDIDKDVAKLLHSAGIAVQALTNRAPKTDSPTTSSPDSLESHREIFKTATSQYFALLSSIDVRLRRQVYALEEASIIPAESSSKAGETVGAAGNTTAASTTNPFEISWLNSRKDTVGKDKEAELWEEAREFVEKLGLSSGDGSKGNASTGNQAMDVD
ncbi:hypothetical protein FQN54_008275 [Arachnomyces sp. PD_36]|nr:hypothetical protein FQN54_008275 [Arachnomyces sp. PD_36]